MRNESNEGRSVSPVAPLEKSGALSPVVPMENECFPPKLEDLSAKLARYRDAHPERPPSRYVEGAEAFREAFLRSRAGNDVSDVTKDVSDVTKPKAGLVTSIKSLVDKIKPKGRAPG